MAQITYTDKNTGDNMLAIDANEIKAVVNANALIQSAGVPKLYVDMVNGLDTNNGDEDAPVKTWSKVFDLVKTGSYKNGFVSVARGSVFTSDDYPDAADVPVTQGHSLAEFPATGMGAVINGFEDYWHGVTIDSYGLGMEPIFDLRKIHTNASWSKTAGRTNIYEISFSSVAETGTTTYGGIWEDGVYLDQIFVNSGGGALVPDFTTETLMLDYLDANPGSWYIDQSVFGTDKYYIHAIDGSDVIANGKEYKSRFFDWFVVSNEGNTTDDSRSFVTVKNMVTIGNSHHNGAIWGANLQLFNITALEVARHGMMVQGYLEKCNVFITNPKFGGGCYHSFSQYQGTRRGTIYKECGAISWEDFDNPASNIAAFYYHAQSGSKMEELQYIDCWAVNCQTMFQSDSNVNLIKIKGGWGKNCKSLFYNIQADASIPCRWEFSDFKFTSNYKDSVALQLATTGNGVYNFNNCEIYWGGLKGFAITASAGTEINIYNSTFVWEFGSETWAKFRLNGGVASPKIRIINSVFANLKGSVLELLETVTGVAITSTDLIIENSTFGDFSVDSNIGIVAIQSAFANITDVDWAETDILNGVPIYGDFGMTQSSLATGRQAGKGIVNVDWVRGFYDLPITR